jgi:hypothetical protein
MGLEAESLREAVSEIIGRTPAREIGLSPSQKSAMRDAVQGTPSHLGRGVTAVVAIAQPLSQAALLFGRSESGVFRPDHDDRIHLIFVLVLPAGAALVQQVFTSAIAATIESDCVLERLMHTGDADEVVEVIGDGVSLAQR